MRNNKNIKYFQEFINEGYVDPEKMNSKEIAEYISMITPSEHDVPDFFISNIKKSGKEFFLRTIKIKDLIENDPSLKEYIESQEERYGDDSDYSPEEMELTYPIVIFNGEVVDGYSRTSTLYKRGKETIEAYTDL